MSLIRSAFNHVLILVFALTIFGQSVPAPAVTEAVVWTPPTPREKAKTPFAPKPTVGNNIFKGDAEKWLADSITKFEGVSLPPITDIDVAGYIDLLGKNLVTYSTVPKKQFEFIVLDGTSEDAFTVGGGKIYITLGMLRAVESEDELAGILAHEIAHDAFAHAGKTATRQLFWMKGIHKVRSPEEADEAVHSLYAAYEKNKFAAFGEKLLGWSRFDELQADRAAFYNIYKAGYNPKAMNEVFRRAGRRNKEALGDKYAVYQVLTFLFGSHPPISQRMMAIKWESLWIKMPPKETRFKNPAFDAMKARVAKM